TNTPSGWSTEVVRLFGPDARGRGPARRRSIIVSPQLHSNTHRFSCLEDKHMELVSNRSVKQQGWGKASHLSRKSYKSRKLSQTESNIELLGPPEKCVHCGEEFLFSTIKNHSDECTRLLQSSDEVRMAVTEEDSHPQDVRQQGPSTLEIPQGPAAAPEIVDLVSIEESGSAGLFH
ncbi:hypothetical protein ATANTOWER_023604, partial [Ataeniobius toweri]|nr:hypothetical protein [Ataeniobius toweri]